jgi:ribulose-5-phosphate 4-epimerase/fuculose-1-phosphate aldolase
MNEDIRSLVATASRILAAAGQGDLIWGHASARDPDGHGVWLKSAHWGLEETTADRVHLVSEDGQVLEGDGQRHSEYPIHTEVMIARPDVGGVVHTHPPTPGVPARVASTESPANDAGRTGCAG